VALRRDKAAVTALEYGLIAALIALAIVAGVTKLGTTLNSLFNNVANSL
jgi:pilus assembly protein Flp/PilA